MAIQISFNGYSLQSSTIITSEVQHENLVQKKLNIQKFSDREGGSLMRPDFDTKIINVKGTIRGSSQANLETTLDTFKKNMNVSEKNLDISYNNGTRRYAASCSKILFDRQYYTIDTISFELEFIITNPPFGFGIDTNTLEDLSNSGSSATTTTIDNIGTADYSGTFRPLPKIKITLNTCNGIRRLIFSNTDEDGYYTRTVIENHKFYNGDVITIDTKAGTVTLNGSTIEFRDGFPRFSLTNNRYNLQIVGKSYNADIKVIYYDYWL